MTKHEETSTEDGAVKTVKKILDDRGQFLNGFSSLMENLEPSGKVHALPTLGLAQFAPSSCLGAKLKPIHL
jgi:hypothetical protein